MLFLIPQIPLLGMILEHYYIGGWNVTAFTKLLMNLHVLRTDSESLLDLIITNCPGYFVNCRTLSPPANCDYSLIFARLNISVSKPKRYNQRTWQFYDVNEEELCNELANFHWDKEVFSNSYDIDDIYSCWFKHSHDIVKTKIPSRIFSIRPRDKSWMDSSVRLAMRKRYSLLKLYCKCKTRASWEKYRQQRNLTTTLIRKNKA